MNNLKKKFSSDQESQQLDVETLEISISKCKSIDVNLQQLLLHKERNHFNYLKMINEIQQNTDLEYQNIAKSIKASQITIIQTAMCFISPIKQIKDLENAHDTSIEMQKKHEEKLKIERIRRLNECKRFIEFADTLNEQIEKFNSQTRELQKLSLSNT